MAKKKDPVADAIARLADLRSIDDRTALAVGVADLLSNKSGYVVARTADLAAVRGVREAANAIIDALSRRLNDPKADDAGGVASLSLVQALIAVEADYAAEDVALRAARHVRWEPVWGGSADVAVAVRGRAVVLLAAMGSTQALTAATELLAEADRPLPRERAGAPARSDAARALTMIGTDGAAAVLHFKLLIGDADPNVVSDCLGGLLTIRRHDALPLAERMLTADDPAAADAALLAVGGWRDRRAFDVLHAHERQFLHSPSLAMYLASVAMTRDAKAIDYLLDLAASADASVRAAAATAIEPLCLLPGVSERLEHARGRGVAQRLIPSPRTRGEGISH